MANENDRDNRHAHKETPSSAQNAPTFNRVFINGHTEFHHGYSDDLGDRMRAAFKARAVEQGLNATSSSSHASCHVSRNGLVTEIGGTARSQAGGKTTSIVFFKRFT